MKRKNILKSIVTFLLILFVLTPISFFLIYPIYNDIILQIKSLNIYRIAQENTVTLLTNLSPLKERYQKEVLGATSIEESLSQSNIILQEKLLENLNTKLSINDLNIQGNIYQGTSSQTMDKGFWHFPISQYPGEKGNVVIIGHRYLNLPPEKDTFFNLDKIKIGDHIDIQHQEGEYTYIVVEKKEVEPNDMSTIKESDDYRLTLITCTPLWTSEKRLVIVAKLDKLYKKV
ncbi:MAG: sortase [Candidatus Dojkabacteria bacterium]